MVVVLTLSRRMLNITLTEIEIGTLVLVKSLCHLLGQMIYQSKEKNKWSM